MLVVCDSKCVSNLLTIGEGQLLSELFGEVIIPPAVEERRRQALLSLG